MNNLAQLINFGRQYAMPYEETTDLLNKACEKQYDRHIKQGNTDHVIFNPVLEDRAYQIAKRTIQIYKR